MHSVMRVETLDGTIFVCIKCGCSYEQFSGPDNMGCFEVRRWRDCDVVRKRMTSHKFGKIDILQHREYGECMGMLGLVKEMSCDCTDCGLEDFTRWVFTWERGGDLIDSPLCLEDIHYTCSQWRMMKALG